MSVKGHHEGPFGQYRQQRQNAYGEWEMPTSACLTAPLIVIQPHFPFGRLKAARECLSGAAPHSTFAEVMPRRVKTAYTVSFFR
jgi:hypothetical protein